MSKNLDLAYLLDFYGNALTQKQREMMEQYYNDDLSLAEIAGNFSITRQGVRDSIKRGEAAMLALEEQIGFAARYRTIYAGLARLEELARDVRFHNAGSYAKSAQIEADTDEMLRLLRGMTQGE